MSRRHNNKSTLYVLMFYSMKDVNLCTEGVPKTILKKYPVYFSRMYNQVQNIYKLTIVRTRGKFEVKFK